jgi:hypothetical protein
MPRPFRERGRVELGCDWHTVNDAVVAYGHALLDADVDRIGEVHAPGLDETLFCRAGHWYPAVVHLDRRRGPSASIRCDNLVPSRRRHRRIDPLATVRRGEP